MAKNEQAIQRLQKQIRIRKSLFYPEQLQPWPKKTKTKTKSDFNSLETYCWIQVSYCSLLEKKNQTFLLKWSIHIATDNINGRSTFYQTDFTQQMLQSDVEGMTSSKGTDVALSSEQDSSADSVPRVPCDASMHLPGQCQQGAQVLANLSLTKSKTCKALFSHPKTMAAQMLMCFCTSSKQVLKPAQRKGGKEPGHQATTLKCHRSKTLV